MGFGGIGPGSIILILLIVILLFGTKKLRNVGSDLGGAIKNFKKSVKDGEDEEKTTESLENMADSTFDEDETKTKKKEEA
ncbi:MAG TPA: twin-arginine translocase TatA/TatE family subunit [Gammaproteobacteria bacterium]|jgi:sec-independent protein translocase protein TatA